MSLLRRDCLSMWLVGALTACGQAELRSHSVEVRDSAGIWIVENRGWPAETWMLSVVPRLVIGGDASTAEAELFRVSSATRLAGGELAIGNAGTGEVLVFGEDASRLQALGGRGNGPGEFPGGLRLIPQVEGGILVEAIRRSGGKLVQFTPAGELEWEKRSETSPPPGAWSLPHTSPRAVVFAIGEDLPMPEAYSSGVTRRPAFLVRYGYDALGVDTIGRYEGTEYLAADLGPRAAMGGEFVTGPRLLQPLFQATTHIASGGTTWRVIADDQAQAAIDIYREDGSLTQRVRWDAEKREPSPQDVERSTAEYFAAAMWQRDPAAVEKGKAIVRRRAERAPTFRNLAVALDGHIWVERYPLPGDEESVWWIFDSRGVAVGSAAISKDLALLEIGSDYVITLAADELGVERVEMWGLER